MYKKSLVEIFSEIGHFGSDVGGNDKNSTHTYLETYDRLFKNFREGCTLLEIGLATGDSIKLWDEYFENSKIIGVDISVVFSEFIYKNDVRIIEMDATNPEILKHLEYELLDLVIEDGSHVTSDQVATFNILKSKMARGGIYIMEDILALDQERNTYLSLHNNCEILDMRNTGRFDNCLIIYRF